MKGRYWLTRGGEAVAPAGAVTVDECAEAIELRNGVVSVRVGRGPGSGVIESIQRGDGPGLGPMDLSIKLNRVGWRDQFTAERCEAVVEEASAVCAIVRIEGEMVLRGSGGHLGHGSDAPMAAAERALKRFGPFRMRLQVWAGLPQVLVEWRLINESDQSMAMLLDWSAQLRLPDLEESVLDFGPMAKGQDGWDPGEAATGEGDATEELRAVPLYRDAEWSVRQEREDQARLYHNIAWTGTVKHAAGFVNLRHASVGLVGAMRWFAEEFPKGIVVKPELLSLAVMPEAEGALSWTHDRPHVRIGRGEGKRSTFGLLVHDGQLDAAEAERFNGCVQDPPRLFDRDWFVDSGVFEVAPRRDHPWLTDWDRKVTGVIASTGIDVERRGHREYWDTHWMNDYRTRSHQGLRQFVETGDVRWLRYFEAVITHHRDVDIIHYCPEHPEWVGHAHTSGEDHTSRGPNENVGTNTDGLLDHYLLTGDPDSLEAAQGLAEHLLNLNPWERCSRCVGWPLGQIARWYDQTGDARFKSRLDDLLDAAHAYIEPRRGVFSEIHGVWNYRGTVPFMTDYLAYGLIRYHRLTHDERALRLLRMLLDGLWAESRVKPGMFVYSPSPETNGVMEDGTPTAQPAVDTMGLAGYLYLTTGDAACLARARESYEAVMDDAVETPVSMDHMTMVCWGLRALVADQNEPA